VPNQPTGPAAAAENASQTTTPITPTQGESGQLNLICVKVCWEGTPKVPSLDAPFHDIWVRREAQYPKGRKGLVMASTWKQMASLTDEGYLTVDADVAIDPVDLNTMIQHVASDRESVWVSRVKLWPVSTHFPTWVWGHRKAIPDGITDPQEIMRLWQQDVDDPDYWTFCFTYLPRALMEAAIKAGLRTWHYPNVDKNMHELAKAKGFKVRVVRGDCFPKHINFK
jgi:hypothetical protein